MTDEAKPSDEAQPFLLPLSDAQLRMVALKGHPLLRILLGLSANIEPIRGDRPSSRGVSTSVLNALGVLAAICEHPESTQAEVAKQAGVSKSTAGRYLKTWEEVGVLERNPSTHGYRLAMCWQTDPNRNATA
jgi:hypothetical protein